ncbi:MAG: DNA polymerase III subunit delta [Chloroflexota bacterium]
MLYLVHGDDDFRRSEWLAELKHTVSLDDGMAELNTVTLNGQRLTPDELQAACGAVPFLADKRLVVVEGLASRGESRQGKGQAAKRAKQDSAEQQMAQYLSQVPPTTDVVLVEDRPIPRTNVFATAVREGGGRVVELRLPKPDSAELRQWIAQRARRRGAKMAPDAGDRLMAFVGNNLRLLDQEIDKLATYAGERPVTAEDVELLVGYTREASIFEMVDAFGRRDARRALVKLHELMDEGGAPTYLLFMIARQVRLLVQARDLLDRGLPPSALANELGVHSYVAQKIGDQARNFSLPALQALHQEILETDWAVKRGRLEPEAALDLFVASVAQRRG